MPYTIKFDNEHNLIDVVCSGNFSMEEIIECDKQIVEQLDQAHNHKLDLLTDLTDLEAHPINLSKVWDATRPIAHHDNLRTWFVLGGTNSLTKFLVEMVTRLGNLSLKIVDSRDDIVAHQRQDTRK